MRISDWSSDVCSSDLGTFFAGNLFMQKCATGLGIFATGLLVDLAGLPEKADPAKVPESVIDNFSFYYCLLVILFAILSSLILRSYRFDRADHDDRLAAPAPAPPGPPQRSSEERVFG